MNEEERDTLAILFNRGRSLRAIAKFLGRSAASLSREIRRNTTETGYRPHSAQTQSQKRLQESHNRARLNNPKLRHRIEGLLAYGWSPELISGWLRKQAGRAVVSHEAIYQWIYRDARHLAVHLARHHRQRRRRFSQKWPRLRIAGRIPLQDRPDKANRRLDPGHWETDLMAGPGHSALQVTVERKTRFTRLGRLPNKKAASAFVGLHRLLQPVPRPLRKSITYDNGSENALHQDLNRLLGTKSYFCSPYHSWEKGTVEQTNGLIRRFLPKKTNFDSISDENLRFIEHWLNTRPRKCLNYQSPADAYNALCVALAC